MATKEYSLQARLNIRNDYDRLLKTYNRIVKLMINRTLIDIGAENEGFVRTCNASGLYATSLDYPEFDAEVDKFKQPDNSIDYITLNSVIEHLAEPYNIIKEINRILVPGGYVFIRTTNFQLDYRNFYNDVTHKKPYTPYSLNMLLELYDFEVVYNEPGLICKSKIWNKLPLKWRIASLIKGGSKSIIIVGKKKELSNGN